MRHARPPSGEGIHCGDGCAYSVEGRMISNRILRIVTVIANTSSAAYLNREIAMALLESEAD